MSVRNLSMMYFDDAEFSLAMSPYALSQARKSPRILCSILRLSICLLYFLIHVHLPYTIPTSLLLLTPFLVGV